ncbi:MAG: hypothetical protein C0467_26365 [Planctomycetaceae bacterium]|nr:hypothetical protein [Planctomycetaceae bacterium]
MEDTFEVTRRAFFRSTPVVATGRFEIGPDGRTIIHVRTDPQVMDVVLSVATTLFITVAAFNSDHIPGSLVPCCFAGFGTFVWFAMSITTTIEERRCRSELSRILTPSRKT